MINNVKATMSIENQKLTHSDIKLLEDFADNKISMDETMDLIKKLIIKKTIMIRIYYRPTPWSV